jgi:hypothetical protein
MLSTANTQHSDPEKIINDLRMGLKYKSVFDFAVADMKRNSDWGEWINRAVMDSIVLGHIPSKDTASLERFQLIGTYDIRPYHCLNGGVQYLLMSEYIPSLVRYVLFRGDSASVDSLDQFNIDGSHASGRILDINGVSFIEVVETNYGIGMYSESITLLNVMEGRFNEAITFDPVSIFTPETGDSKRMKREMSIVDIDNDGSLDIRLKCVEERVKHSDNNGSSLEKLKESKSASVVSQYEVEYLWSSSRLLFVQQPINR